MKTDFEIQQDVMAELLWEPALNGTQIGVSVNQGIVMLSGVVDTHYKKVLAEKWYIDELYDLIFAKPILAIGTFFKNIIEKSGIDGIVNGIGSLVQYTSRKLRLLQSGKTGSYILMMVVSLCILFMLFWNQTIIVSFFNKIF